MHKNTCQSCLSYFFLLYIYVYIYTSWYVIVGRAGVNKRINDGWIPFRYFIFRVLKVLTGILEHIYCTCAFPTVTTQNVYCENGLMASLLCCPTAWRSYHIPGAGAINYYYRSLVWLHDCNQCSPKSWKWFLCSTLRSCD